MKKMKKMKKIYLYILGFSSLFVGISAYAQSVTCTPKGNCENLGYTNTTAACKDGLKCPFDESKVFCSEKPIEPVLPEECDVGSILYSDKTCSKKVITGKTAVAVVFDIEKKLAVALEENTYLKWGKHDVDIPALTNCGVYLLSPCDINGKANTTAILAYGKANSISYPAAEYCSNYITEGTIAGNWFLPSFAELKGIYNAKSDINSGLQILGKSVLTESYYWPSIEESANYSSILIMDGGYSGSHYKTNSNYVRPIIAY